MVAPTDMECALAALAAETATSWDFSSELFHALLTKRPDGSLLLAPRGSENFMDWLVDFDVLDPDSFDHPDLGIIDAGFDRSSNDRLADIIIAIKAAGSPMVYGTGHSKGGAEIEIIAAKLELAGITMGRIVTFGAPRWLLTGNTKVSPLIAKIPGIAYRHFKDRVTQVALEPWDHPPTRQPVQIGTGTLVDLLDVAAMHHMSAYIASLPLAPITEATT